MKARAGARFVLTVVILVLVIVGGVWFLKQHSKTEVAQKPSQVATTKTQQKSDESSESVDAKNMQSNQSKSSAQNSTAGQTQAKTQTQTLAQTGVGDYFGVVISSGGLAAATFALVEFIRSRGARRLKRI
ncbi:MAG: hypothetical protein LBM73_01670 [Candidatus Nomurabacteria bacterium]|jgi:cytoskeletal protein RodZ|nr:hypothetical protein [Candidatus Nomurabacteria bacterium]